MATDLEISQNFSWSYQQDANPARHSYKFLADALATIETTGYFNVLSKTLAPTLTIGAQISVLGLDGGGLYQVTEVSPDVVISKFESGSGSSVAAVGALKMSGGIPFFPGAVPTKIVSANLQTLINTDFIVTDNKFTYAGVVPKQFRVRWEFSFIGTNVDTYVLSTGVNGADITDSATFSFVPADRVGSTVLMASEWILTLNPTDFVEGFFRVAAGSVSTSILKGFIHQV